MSGFTSLETAWGNAEEGLASSASVSSPSHGFSIEPPQQQQMDPDEAAFAMMRQQPPMGQGAAPAPAPKPPSKEEMTKFLHHQLINVITSQNKYLHEQLVGMKDSHKKTQKTIENMSYVLYALLGVTALSVILLIVFYFKMNK